MKNSIILLLCLIPYSLFSQVELISNDASKYYPDGTQITYLTLSDYPSDKGFLEFVNSHVVKDDRIHRFILSKNGNKCFFEADDDVDEDVILEAINEAFANYYSQPVENRHTAINKNDIPKTNSVSVRKNPGDVSNFNSTSVTSFKKSDYNGKYYRVAFKLEDTPNMDNVKSATIQLKERGNFEDISIVDNIHFELSSLEPISADFVIEIFEEFGLKIEDEFIK